jgi:hypothetical protein
MRNTTLKAIGAAALLASLAAPASAAVIFSDDFNRSNSNSVGSGWVEDEDDSDDVAISGNALRLRDTQFGNPDASASRLSGISTVGFTNIVLSYAWAPLSGSDRSDDLYVQWRVGPSGAWQTVGSHTLGGGSGYTPQSFSLGLSAVGVADFELRFWTDVSSSSEGALIDYVTLSGDARNTVPEPSSLAMLALGLIGLGAVRRKAAR